MIEWIDSQPLDLRIACVSILVSGILAILVVSTYAWHLSEKRYKQLFEKRRRAEQERLKINATWDRFSGPMWRS